MLTRSVMVRILIIAFVGGAFVASSTDYFVTHWQPVLCMAAALFIGGWWFKHYRTLALVYLAVAGALIGLGWGGWYQARLKPPMDFFADFSGRATIVSEPIPKPTYQQLIVALPNNRRLLVRAETYPLYHYGDVVDLDGQIEPVMSFDTKDGKVFNYPQYLLMKYRVVGLVTKPRELIKVDEGQGSIVVAKILLIKQAFENAIARVLPEPTSTLARGLLTGGGNFSENLKQTMQKTGTSHIVAISGYNITIILLIFFLSVRQYIGFRWAMASGFIGLAVFIVITGASASVVRAGIMGSLFLLAKLVGRQNKVAYTVFLAALIMVALNPLIVRFDAGFQLSFLAILGLVYFSQSFDAGFTRHLPPYRHLGASIREAVSATCAAQLVTWPVIAGLSGQISLVAPLVNAILLPLVPATMAVSFGVALVALISPFVGQTVSLTAWLPLTFFIRIITGAARLPAAALTVHNLPWWIMPVWFGALTAWLVVSKLRIKNEKLRIVEADSTIRGGFRN
jgi:competence protein ComEC